MSSKNLAESVSTTPRALRRHGITAAVARASEPTGGARRTARRSVSELAAVALLSLFVAAGGGCDLFGPGARGNPTVRPIGGGEGYAEIVEEVGEPVREFDGSDGLLARLAAAESGDVVYVADDARIEIPNWYGPPGDETQAPIRVKRGVTLASGRGRGSLGGLIYFDDPDPGRHRSLFQLERGSRVTGLRFQGPTIAYDWDGCLDTGGSATALLIEGTNDGHALGIRVDNNEIYGWQMAVNVMFADGVRVDHNHLHHNQRKEESSGCRSAGLGYGVVVYIGKDDGTARSAHALIEANLFDHNRHDIASDGGPGASYTARYNIVHDARIAQSFDVHEGKDVSGDFNQTAGRRFTIEHNTFLQSSQTPIKIRAVPTDGVFVDANEFLHANREEAIVQHMESDGWRRLEPLQKIRVGDSNVYSIDPAKAWFVSYGGASVPIRRPERGITQGSEGSPADREPGLATLRRFESASLLDVALGDFDCDGRADAFRATGSHWEFSSAAIGDWEQLNVSGIGLASLRFGDFDGDGCTDVFRAKPSARAWYVSWGGRSGWQKLNTSAIGVEHLRFVDLNGDDRTDVLRANGRSWFVSLGGSSGWQHVLDTEISVSQVGIGDFDGDGWEDVFYADGIYWWYWDAQDTTWRYLETSSLNVFEVLLGDFDGDGVTDMLDLDLLGLWSRTWKISWGGASEWEEVATPSSSSLFVRLGDVNGDGATDILSSRTLD